MVVSGSFNPNCDEPNELSASISDEYLTRLIDAASIAAGIDVSIYRTDHLLRRFEKAKKRLKLKTWSELIDAIENDESGRKLITDMLPVGTGGFFRDLKQYKVLESLLSALPCRKENREGIRILSAGCGTGEEAYSIAMLADRLFTPLRLNWEVIGIDINEDRISQADDGCYKADAIKEIPGEYQNGIIVSTARSNIAIRDDIRANCTFIKGNIFLDDMVDNYNGALDVITLRYISVYLKAKVARKIFCGLAKLLKPGGIIWLGEGEYIENCTQIGLRMIEPAFYERDANAGDSIIFLQK